MLSRRKFIGASVAAILIGAPSLSEARPLKGGTNLGFNGGKTQVNLNFDGGVGGDYPFINNMLSFGPPSLEDNGGSPLPSDMDSNDYPLPGCDAITNHGGIFWTGLVPSIPNGGSLYAVQVTGKGRVVTQGSIVQSTITSITPGTTTAIDFGASHNFTAGMEAPCSGISGTLGTQLNGNGPFVVSSITATGIVLNVNTVGKTGGGGTVACGTSTIGVATGGRYVVDITGVGQTGSAISINIAITATDATTPVTKIAHVRVGSEESRYNNGEFFGIDFLTKLQSANFGVYRFLNKLNTNISNVVNWSDRTPVTCSAYGGTRFPSSFYAGTAGGTGIDYTGTLGTGGPSHGTKVITQFPARAVTVSSNGGNAQVNLTGHGWSIGDAFNFFGTSGQASVAPGNAPFTSSGVVTNNYFIVGTGFTANSFLFSTTFGGSPVAFTSAGSSVAAAKTVVDNLITFTSGSANISWSGQLPAINSAVSFAIRTSGTMPSNISPNGIIYYVKTASAGVVTVSATVGGTAIVAATSSTGTPVGIQCLTYNLNGSGAKPMLNQGAQAMSVGGNNIPRAKYAGFGQTVGSLTYDAVIGCWLAFGAQDGFATQGMSSFWPPELCFALCNHPMIRAHPWFSSPAYVLDPISDYMPSLATYMKSVQPGWMIPRYEVHNELWNLGFSATTLGMAHADAYVAAGAWTVGGFDEYCGKVGSVLGQALNNVYNSSGVGYQMIVGVWTSVMDSAPNAALHDSRLSAAQYVSQSASPQSPYTKSPASNWSTNVCCAQYLTPSIIFTPTDATLAAAFAGVRFTGSISGSTLSVASTEFGALANGMTLFGQGITTPVTITGSGSTWTISGATYSLPIGPLFAGADMTAPVTFTDSLLGAATPYNLAFVSNVYGVIGTWSRQTKFNNTWGQQLKMCGYEGGYSPDYLSGGFSQSDMLHFGGKFTASLQGYTKTNYDNFVAAGGEFPSCFQFTGLSPSSNAWSVLEDQYQFPLPPQWLAIVAYNH